MKLFVIVVALLSERFFVHATSSIRFNWFSNYCRQILSYVSQYVRFSSSWLKLILIIIPIIFPIALALYISGKFIYGFPELLLNIFIFYYCLGPANPFYPEHYKDENHIQGTADYLACVNEQLFAVVFWYILFGPIAALIYRLVSLSSKEEGVSKAASLIHGILDWMPVKMTALLYLLAGNFQSGFQYFTKLFFSMPASNQAMLRQCGLGAASISGEEPVNMPRAETLVEHALLILLVFLSFITLASWV